MNSLLNAMTENSSRTLNGAVTHASTSNPCLDLFFSIGASRNNPEGISHLFSRAMSYDPELAIATLLWAGDVRGGAGERNVFKTYITRIMDYVEVIPLSFFNRIVELTRWDNLFVFVGTTLESEMFDYYQNAIKSGNALAAKWAPREKSAKRDIAIKFRKHMGLTSKQYRKMMSAHSDTVEQKMSNNQWSSIEYDKLPSLASARYQKTFMRHDEHRYMAYIEKLKSGDTKINAGAVYPYDIVKSLVTGNADVASAQWDALPNYLEGTDERIISVVDTSGSMFCPVGGNPTLRCVDVAVSLGLYVAEKNNGAFKDSFITFSERPSVQLIKGKTLKQRYNSVSNADWGYSTNLELVFDSIVNSAIKNNVSPEEMPTKVLIISDMEFDRAVKGTTLSASIRKKYKDSGYELPDVVFWRVDIKQTENFPVRSDESGMCLVSGFSPSICKSVLTGEMNPISVMVETVGKDRYYPDFIKSDGDK